MHRSFTIAVASEATAELLESLSADDGVVTLAVHRGAAVRPAGDLISVVALNTAADMIITRILDGAADGPAPAIITASVDSVLHRPRQDAILSDHDEATWEEAATAMRRHSRPNLNLALLSMAGAVLAVCALTSSSQLTQAGALVALQILPALAATGIALELGRWVLAAQSLGRVGIDVAMVLIAGVAVFTFKHRTVHERRAPVH